MTDQAVDAALRRYHHEGPAPDPADLATIRRRVLARTAEPHQHLSIGVEHLHDLRRPVLGQFTNVARRSAGPLVARNRPDVENVRFFGFCRIKIRSSCVWQGKMQFTRESRSG